MIQITAFIESGVKVRGWCRESRVTPTRLNVGIAIEQTNLSSDVTIHVMGATPDEQMDNARRLKDAVDAMWAALAVQRYHTDTDPTVRSAAAFDEVYRR